MILTVHIGGDAVSLGLFQPAPPEREPVLVRSASVPASEYPELRAVLRRFAAEELPRLTAAGVAVAGRVVHGRCIDPLPWEVEASQVAAALGGIPVELVDEAELRAERSLGARSPHRDLARRVARLSPRPAE